MIQVGTQLQIIDNSGGKIAQCVRVYKKKTAAVGDKILVSIQNALPRHRVQKGDLYKAIVVQTKKSLKRPDGTSLRNFQNGIILVNDKEEAVGTRVTSAFNFEIRTAVKKAWFKVLIQDFEI